MNLSTVNIFGYNTVCSDGVIKIRLDSEIPSTSEGIFYLQKDCFTPYDRMCYKIECVIRKCD